jgi:hypothetical protein
MSDDETATGIIARGDGFSKDIDLLTEIIARLQETATEMGRDLSPREFAAMSATIYRRLKENSSEGSRKNRLASIKPQIHDLLEYETLRHKRGK